MAPQRKPKEFVLHEQTLSRRDLLDWMGKATVFSLSGGVLAACLSGEDPDGGRAPDAEAGGEREHAPGGDDAREAEVI